jgi:streptogramin lyase
MKIPARACLIVLLFSLFVPMLAASAAPVTLNEAAGFANPARIFSGVDGRLYVVGEETGTLWRINPSTGGYEKYFPALTLKGAIPDGAGKVWWTDGDKTFGYLDLTKPYDGSYSWEIPETAGNSPYLGPVITLNGQVWMATYMSALFGVFRFTPDAGGAQNGGELCQFPISGGSYATEMVLLNGKLWWLNWINGSEALVSLAPGADSVTLTRYALNRNVNQRAGILAYQGKVWWVEDVLGGDVYNFNPATGNITTYDLPANAQPIKIAAAGGRIWYTDSSGWFASLDPATTQSTKVHLSETDQETILQSCYTPLLGAPTFVEDVPHPGKITWTPNSGDLSQPQAGLDVYALITVPPMPAFLPLGITAAGNGIWVGDNGRNKLVKLEIKVGYNIYLPSIRR